MALALLILGALALYATVLGLFAPRRPHTLTFTTFFLSWLAADLAAFHILAKVVVGGALVSLGGLDATKGVIGACFMVASIAGDVVLMARQKAAAPALDAALRDVLGPDAPSVAAEPVPLRQLAKPFPPSTEGVEIIRDIRYGPAPRNRLDVIRPADHRSGCPVLMQIHGGAWFSGDKREQGQPLMRHLARQGWVCVAPDYRLSPKASFPDHLIDVKMALAWAREHIAAYGGDPDYIAVTGGSAGGHLAALVGVTANMPELQPGFEHVDTSVVACMPVYAVFDFLNTAEVRKRFTLRTYNHLMSRMLMKTRLSEDEAGWRLASPLSHVRADLPPFFVVQGAQDTLVWREEPRHFAEAMREAGNPVVGYAEVPYAQHAFDIMVTLRSTHTVRAMTAFLEAVRDGRIGNRPQLSTTTNAAAGTSTSTDTPAATTQPDPQTEESRA